MACATLDLFVLEFGKGEKHGTSIQKAERVLRQDRLCAVGRRRVRWPWQYLAFPVSGGQVWRRHLSAHLHSAGVHVRLYHDRGGDGSGPDDQEEPGGRFRGLWQKGRALVRRLDQRHHPHPHRALLLGHWRSSGTWRITLPGTARSWPRTAISRRSSPMVLRRRSALSSSPSSRWRSSLRASATAWNGSPKS